MSIESATQFLDRLSNDPSLRVQLQNAGTPSVKTVMDFALNEGLVFTEGDLKSALAKYPDSPMIEQLRDRLRVKATV